MGKMKELALKIAECEKCEGAGILSHTRDDVDYEWACECNPYGL
jgi:hypothetical protein